MQVLFSKGRALWTTLIEEGRGRGRICGGGREAMGSTISCARSGRLAVVRVDSCFRRDAEVRHRPSVLSMTARDSKAGQVHLATAITPQARGPATDAMAGCSAL